MTSPIQDGLLHLRQAELEALPLEHLWSGTDDDDLSAAQDCGRLATLSGYTEWVSPQARTLTLGWDWQLLAGAERPRVMRRGLPRTNIQVLDESLRPLPWEHNLQWLAAFIDRIDWASPAFEAVCQKHVN
ncbi:DUF4902 domain-containing protein [Xenophilus arseniciresistens]|uniref:DUF4902 domain-containing protein n=1 Tax=Xenophilus arseniciresistens TaxID=1283306 RepID=A0AAE3SYZ5_9BURK|nr:DUF4902 domain-containing protein [Xenophilus arseniciresistens]MDA7414757.1 DUF4902 domain-containing protein [Xenophilus arseniciresistens]